MQNHAEDIKMGKRSFIKPPVETAMARASARCPSMT